MRDLEFDEKHGDFGFGVDLPYDVENLIDQKWREAKARLIKQEQSRLGHQGARDRQHLRCAAECMRRLGDGSSGETREQGEHMLHQYSAPGTIPMHGGSRQKILGGREVAENATPFQYMHDPSPDPVGGVERQHIRAIERDLSARHLASFWHQQPAYGFQDSAFASPVGTEKSDEAGFRYFDRNALYREKDAIIDNFDIVKREKRHLFLRKRRPMSSGTDRLRAAYLPDLRNSSDDLRISAQTMSWFAANQSLAGTNFAPSQRAIRPPPPPW